MEEYALFICLGIIDDWQVLPSNCYKKKSYSATWHSSELSHKIDDNKVFFLIFSFLHIKDREICLNGLNSLCICSIWFLPHLLMGIKMSIEIHPGMLKGSAKHLIIRLHFSWADEWEKLSWRLTQRIWT